MCQGCLGRPLGYCYSLVSYTNDIPWVQTQIYPGFLWDYYSNLFGCIEDVMSLGYSSSLLSSVKRVQDVGPFC